MHLIKFNNCIHLIKACSVLSTGNALAFKKIIAAATGYCMSTFVRETMEIIAVMSSGAPSFVIRSG